MDHSFEDELRRIINSTAADADEVIERMLANPPPTFNPNWLWKGNWTLLQLAWARPRVVACLLRHPSLDPNFYSTRELPLTITAKGGCPQTAQLLLEDWRVRVNGTALHNPTAFSVAVFYGEHKVLEIMMASIRRLRPDLPLSRINPDNDSEDLRRLLESYKNRPFKTVKELRAKYGLQKYGPLLLFCFVVLTGDGYFKILTAKGIPKKATRQATKCSSAIRFFSIISGLPMELQMIICNRVYDLPTDMLKAKDVNWAVKIFVADNWLDGE